MSATTDPAEAGLTEYGFLSMRERRYEAAQRRIGRHLPAPFSSAVKWRRPLRTSPGMRVTRTRERREDQSRRKTQARRGVPPYPLTEDE